MEKRQAYAEHDGERFLDAVQNARLVANAERYYRIMYYGSRASWNLRDSHMFETLKTLLGFHGPGSKAIVWAHNSHVGDSAATEMASRGEYNIGHLCRQEFGDAAYSIGFGTEQRDGRSSLGMGRADGGQSRAAGASGSYERLCHDAGHRAFLAAVCAADATTLPTGLLKTAPRTRHRGDLPAEDRSCRATIFRPSCRTSSTNTSGSTKRKPSRR